MDTLTNAHTDKWQEELSYPTLQRPINLDPKPLSAQWECVALLHPFSPPPEGESVPESPFFQLCTATIRYIENKYMRVYVVGEDGRTWRYIITPTETKEYRNGKWERVDMGWKMPSREWFSDAECIGSSPLNWMDAQTVDWWKKPAPKGACTWFWLLTEGENAGFPLRMMFCQVPPSPTKGDPTQLAFFQMYSFTYLCRFQSLANTEVEIDAELLHPEETAPKTMISGFQFGNPHNYERYVWNDNFGMSSFSTPVSMSYNPCPTRVLYTWSADSVYHALTDRVHKAVLRYDMYNPQLNMFSFETLMFGAAPNSLPHPPKYNGSSFFIQYSRQPQPPECENVLLGGQPPNWMSSPGADGRIRAVLDNNADFCPNQNIVICSALFPPTEEYPQGRYLWTWNSVFTDSPVGTHTRPVTFMVAANNHLVPQGGLGLTDYFAYKEFHKKISTDNFEIPPCCIR